MALTDVLSWIQFVIVLLLVINFFLDNAITDFFFSKKNHNPTGKRTVRMAIFLDGTGRPFELLDDFYESTQQKFVFAHKKNEPVTLVWTEKPVHNGIRRVNKTDEAGVSFYHVFLNSDFSQGDLHEIV